MPSLLFPTATDDHFASDKWSAGVGVVALVMPGNWVLGVLTQNVWSFAGDDSAADVNQLLLQPIINYNLARGWYLTSVSVITANWEADSVDRWTVPLGGGFGKITRLGKQPVDLSMQAYYNVEKPNPLEDQGINLDNQGKSWTLRLQIKFLFPKTALWIGCADIPDEGEGMTYAEKTTGIPCGDRFGIALVALIALIWVSAVHGVVFDAPYYELEKKHGEAWAALNPTN